MVHGCGLSQARPAHPRDPRALPRPSAQNLTAGTTRRRGASIHATAWNRHTHVRNADSQPQQAHSPGIFKRFPALSSCAGRPLSLSSGQQAFSRQPSHRHPSRLLRASSQGMQEYTESSLAKSDLKEILAGSQRGLKPLDPSVSQNLWKAIDVLEASQKGLRVTSPDLLSASWRMLWTTEKETLFILKWAPLFGTSAGEVYQPIDLQSNSLSNIITFPPSGSFVVKSTAEVIDEKRVGFKFLKATLNLPSRSLDLPPFGQGWFDNVYIDEDIRISKDSRGDTLVTERAEPSSLNPAVDLL